MLSVFQGPPVPTSTEIMQELYHVQVLRFKMCEMQPAIKAYWTYPTIQHISVLLLNNTVSY